MVMNNNLALSFQGRIMSEYPDQFRRVWVQYTNIGKHRARLCVTLFPIDGGHYRMLFTPELKEITWEIVAELINNH